MFLADFSTKPTDDKKKKFSMLGTAKNLVIGKTLPGMLTRAATVGTIGAGLYGAKRMNRPVLNDNMWGDRAKYRKMQLAKKTAGIAGVGAGTTALALGGNEVRKEYDRRNRKWWEVL